MEFNNKECINSFCAGDQITALCMSEGNILVSCSGFLTKIMKLWNLDNGKCLSSSIVNPRSSYTLLYILKNNILVSASTDVIMVWDLNRQYDYLNAYVK